MYPGVEAEHIHTQNTSAKFLLLKSGNGVLRSQEFCCRSLMFFSKIVMSNALLPTRALIVLAYANICLLHLE